EIRQGEHEGDLGDRCGQRIPPQIFPDQIHDAAREPDAEPGESDHSTRDMKIEDAKNRILARFVGQAEKDRMKIPGQQRCPDRGEKNNNWITHAYVPRWGGLAARAPVCNRRPLWRTSSPPRAANPPHIRTPEQSSSD